MTQLRDLPTDVLMTELMRRKVLLPRIRVTIIGEGAPDPIILDHGSTLYKMEGNTTGLVMMEAMIDGDWRNYTWVPPQYTGHERCTYGICYNPAKYLQCPARPGIHQGQYD